MKKFLTILTAAVATLQLQAAPVDVAAAQKTAQQYLAKTLYAGKYMSPAATKAELIYTEMGEVNKTTPVFYIFNTATTYLIVSGDDRAEEVLAYGDKPLNLDRIPLGLRDMMNVYKHEIDWLISNPKAKVNKPTTYKSPKIAAGETYGPLLTALWDQEAPYWNQCKFTHNGTQYQCLTGCPATSASMVMYYWKYPTTPVDAIPSYSAALELSYSSTVNNYAYPALPAVTFDWDNMKDSYTGSYTTAQGNAVATLMRYVGQAEHMMYGTSSAGGSGIYSTDAQNVVDMFELFGYDEETCRLAQKSSYTEANWANLLQTEMIEGRPVVYLAVAGGWFGGGHAFNVDGYNSSTNKYHVNFGWSGDGNNWLSMNSFSDGAGSTYNQDQQMVIGIQPGIPRPKIIPSETTLKMNSISTLETKTATFTVEAVNLEGDITVTVTDAKGAFSTDVSTISIEEATQGKTVTVTFAPQEAGSHTATITLSSANATSVNITLTGNATKGTLPAPELSASDITSNSFTVMWTHPVTSGICYTVNVSSMNGSSVLSLPDFTEQSYNLTGLTAGASYICAVKAVPVNTNQYKESSWARMTVKLNAEPAYDRGDVNGDGSVDIDDVDVIIKIILGTASADNYGGRAELTGNSRVDVDDMNEVIAIILAGQN